MEFSESDRRTRLRFPILVTQVKMGEDRKYFFGYAKNISCSGLFVQTISPKEVGETFSIEFIVPGTEITIKCQCRVVWNRKFTVTGKYEPGMGLTFDDLPEEMADKIDAWIRGQAGFAEMDEGSL
jgi:Tfp pilus assembly protein PilZ